MEHSEHCECRTVLREVRRILETPEGASVIDQAKMVVAAIEELKLASLELKGKILGLVNSQ